MSHAEMRANAKRKLQEQLERRMLQEERRRRMAPYAGVILALLALVIVLMYIFSRPAPLDTPTQIGPPLAPVTTTTTTWPSTHQEWMQYCATHIDTVECGNGSDVTPTTPPTSAPPDWPTTCEQSSAPSWCPNKRTQPGCADEYCPGNPWEVCSSLQTGRGAPTWCDPYLPQRTAPPTTTTTTPPFPTETLCDTIQPRPPRCPPPTVPGVPGSRQGQAI